MVNRKKKVSLTKRKTKKMGKKKGEKKRIKLECHVCGYRLIVDRKCGCAEEHVLFCCGQPMKKVETMT
jgi:hypothetical protein